MPSGKTIRSGESAGISSALKTTDMATLMAAFGDAKSPTLNSGTHCMSGPVFAIRVPPRLQEVIPPYYKRRKIERPTRKKSSAQGRNASAHDRRGQRVCVGPDRDHDERIPPFGILGVVQRSRAATPTDTFVCFIEGADAVLYDFELEMVSPPV